MKKVFLLLLLAVNILGISNDATAQTQDSLPTITYGAPKDYEVGGVKVVGVQYTDANAIIGVSGLQVGKKIKFPGPDVQKAMKALWKLRLFDDVQIVKEKTIGDVIFFEILIKERPSMTTFSYVGAKKSQHDDLNGIVTRFIPKGTIVTESNKANVINGVTKYYREKGFLDASVKVTEEKDPKRVNGVKLIVSILKANRIKIQDITFEGNANASARKLRKKMDKTHRKLKIFSSSKLIRDEYEEDKKKILKYYGNIGFRDAQVVSDSIWREKDGDLKIHMKINEGRRYYFRNIVWKGNSIYESQVLSQVLGIQKGDIYNAELLDQRLRFSQDGRDVSSLYMDNGYLFFNVEPTEVAIDGDSIDLEMRLYEGPQATIDKVTIKGNDRTHEHVIRRELRTLPGEKFSRSDIIRSQREIINLGYFNQEALGINTPVNPQRGTVDIEYKVEEKPSDQLELSAGWGGFGVVGTLGVSFNNFSIRNIFNKSAWSPLPQGDGQRLSIRAQSNGKYYQSYNISFTEPWLGGKRPNSLTVGSSYSKFSGYYTNNSVGILQASVGLGRRMKWPDDNFVSNTSLEFQQFSLKEYPGFFPNISNGTFNSFNLSQTFSRNSISDPLFPKSGSRLTLILTATPPYSLFNGKRYSDLSYQEKFKWVEFYKWRFNAEWYTPVAGKMVLRTAAKVGSLGYYNKYVGYTPFNRFVLGGDGLANRQIAQVGQEILAMRGYKVDEFPNSQNGGGTTFAKYTAELRYPISLNPSSTIFATAFVEGGNTWGSLKDFKPFDVRRAAGLGLRVFLPMFGTLGFDYGIGFDKPNVTSGKFTDFGTFNIVLGFEPD
ncbi:MAG: outer membrane protein assembly factor BamA [Saprospiraceae bacterium]|nr:outer membrane protein assembly factor BamA [Saprospiraceae bacterium]